MILNRPELKGIFATVLTKYTSFLPASPQSTPISNYETILYLTDKSVFFLSVSGREFWRKNKVMFTLQNPLVFTEKWVGLKTSGKTRTFQFSLLIQTQATDRKHLILRFSIFEREIKLTYRSVYLRNKKTYH